MGKLPVRKYKKGANRVSIIPISAFAVHYSFLIDKNKDYRYTVVFRNSKIYSLHLCRDKLYINLCI